jgi:hypothetical protein
MIELARGKYIAFLSADDEYCMDRFGNQIKLLEENPMVKIIHSNGTNVKNGITVSAVLSDNICDILKEENPYKLYSHITENNDPLYMQGLLIESEFLRKFDPFDPELINDDWIFNIKSTQSLCQNGFKFKFLNQQVFIRNLLPNSTSNISAHHIPRVLGVINKYCKNSSRPKLKMRIYLNQAIISFKNKNFKFIIFTIYSIINGAAFVGHELLKKVAATDARRNN